ncbi:MAG: D-aminoacylase [Nitrospirae bacterium]|nr:D-aminoacylase [Nitrospirota bacterium]
MKIDLLIKNGLVFDGTFSEPFEANIGISEDKILFIDKRSKMKGREYALSKKAAEIIDAKGLSVAPGFIDTHAHSDFTLLADPRAEGKICQGITTEINGNCGISASPLYNDALKQREEDLKELGINERWSTLKEYFNILEKKKIAVNFATLVGHGNIKASVKGYEKKDLTNSELRKMCYLLRDSIKDGAIGLSTGLIYPPGIYSKTDELIEMAKSCRDLIYTTHMRSEGERLIESLKETIEIGEKSGIKIHISHIKTNGEENWHKVEEVISMMEKTREKGITLTCDRYPYTASSTDLDSILPPWIFSGGKEKELERLKNINIRNKIKNHLLKNRTKSYWENIFISYLHTDRNKWMLGESLYKISQLKNKDPVDIMFDILIEENLGVGAIFSSMSEHNLKRFLTLKYCMIGSDSSARCFSGPTHRGKPHPRAFGSFPRFLGKYVRDESLMSIIEGIHKITMLPAITFGIRKRGVIKEGAFADIVIFNLEKLNDKATFENPFLKPEGIYYVLLNGLPSLWEGEITGIRAGRILRNRK